MEQHYSLFLDKFFLPPRKYKIHRSSKATIHMSKDRWRLQRSVTATINTADGRGDPRRNENVYTNSWATPYAWFTKYVSDIQTLLCSVMIIKVPISLSTFVRCKLPLHWQWIKKKKKFCAHRMMQPDWQIKKKLTAIKINKNLNIVNIHNGNVQFALLLVLTHIILCWMNKFKIKIMKRSNKKKYHSGWTWWPLIE